MVASNYDFVWLLDADAEISSNSVLNMITFMQKNNVHLSQPRILSKYNKGRSSDHVHLRASSDTGCVSMSAPIVEVMAPCFRRQAWVHIYNNLLVLIQNSTLKKSVAGIDLIWCKFLQHTYGPRQTACQIPSRYKVSPIIHHDERSIEKNKGVLRSKHVHPVLKSVPMTHISATCLRRTQCRDLIVLS